MKYKNSAQIAYSKRVEEEAKKIAPRKCYNCREEHDGYKIYCKECLEKQKDGTLNVKSSSTLVIYDKI